MWCRWAGSEAACEVTRDIAIKFNEQYGQTFIIPEPQIRSEVAKVPGIDGEKMSKRLWQHH